MFVHAETPAALIHAMSTALAEVRDPRARHWLILPGRGRSEAVLKQWARTTGIASHSQEVQLRDLIEQAAAGTGPRFNFDRLRLAIASELPLLCQRRDLADCPIPEGAALTPVSAAVLDWAEMLARAIDDALLCRPPGERWLEGSFLEALFQTPGVEAMVRPHIGSLTSPEFEKNTLAWMDSWESRGGLPHLWLGLDAGLPLLQYERLMELIRIVGETFPGRLRLFALTPSQEYWAECLTRGRSRRMPGGNPAEPDPDCHPGGMLWAFGRCSQDLHRQLSDTLMAVGDGGTLFESPAPPDSLLGRLQVSCRRASPLEPEARLIRAREDASLTVHSCRSTLRELEVCRDRILQARHELHDLRYEEILLLLADPKRQAPFVEAALRTDDTAHGSLPFRLQGFGEAVPSALAEGISLLLEKTRGRLGLEDLQILIEHPLISAKFGFKEAGEDGQDLVSWLADANFRWGLDAGHRTLFQDIPETRWNLSWALQRLGLGALINAEHLGSVVTPMEHASETVPLERATGLTLTSLAQLARFATALNAARAVWSAGAPQPIADWNTQLLSLVDTFLEYTEPSPAQHYTRLTNAILPALEHAVGTSHPLLAPDAYRRLLDEKLVAIAESGARGNGGICVADLRQYAGVPARLILIAGLDDGAFPGRDDRPAWNPLAKNRKTGDPSIRNSDRHALLLAVLACRERLVLSYQGGSDVDSKEKPPSTALSDLLQAVDAALHPAPDASPREKPHSQILFRHPLNGFSPTAFPLDLAPSQRGFLKSDAEAARTLNAVPGKPPFSGPWDHPLPPEQREPQTRLPLSSFHQLVREPARLFLQRLGVSLPERLEAIDGGDLLALGGLEKWTLSEQLLFACIEGKSLEDMLERFRVAGALPRGEIGNEIAQSLIQALPSPPAPFFEANQKINRVLRFTLQDPEQAGNLCFVEGKLQGGWYRSGASSTAHFYSASKRSLKHELQLCVDALALCASYEDAPDGAPARVEMHFQKTSKKAPPPVLELPSPAQARAQLEALLPIYSLSRQLPLPFWPETAKAILDSLGSTAPPTYEAITEALNAGFIRWSEGSFGSGGGSESESRTTRYAFRGCVNPLQWNPNTAALRGLSHDGLPLAWRLFVFFRDWKDNVGLR